jgi:hypothetical protein
MRFWTGEGEGFFCMFFCAKTGRKKTLAGQTIDQRAWRPKFQPWLPKNTKRESKTPACAGV